MPRLHFDEYCGSSDRVIVRTLHEARNELNQCLALSGTEAVRLMCRV
jgi:hypothetical protein